MFDIGRVWELLAPDYGHLAASCFSTHFSIYRMRCQVLSLFTGARLLLLIYFFKECGIRNALPKNCGTLMSAQGGG